MPDDPDLQLNSLSRYSKKSERFTLEVHNHCEVPAGCGGAILRWLNPRRAIPLTMWLHTAAPHELFLDGAAMMSASPLLSLGQSHIVAIHLTEAETAHGVLMFAAFTTHERIRTTRHGAPIPDLEGLSAADGSWKYTTTKPPDDWTQPEFDDSAWAPMIEKEMLKPGDQDPNVYRYRLVAEMGALGLGIPLRLRPPWTTKKEIWVRKSLMIPEDSLE